LASGRYASRSASRIGQGARARAAATLQAPQRITRGFQLTHLPVQRANALAPSALARVMLQNVETFSSMFLCYDLLARRWVPYSYLYPFAEGLAGVLMVARALPWLSIPVAPTIGGIGAVSVFKAVYVDRREIRCACVGGDSGVPLGFVSLTENLMMVGMALWML
jgi:hypothetical protein